MTCQHCGTEFTATRRDARYCGPACRQRARRAAQPTFYVDRELVAAQRAVERLTATDFGNRNKAAVAIMVRELTTWAKL